MNIVHLQNLRDETYTGAGNHRQVSRPHLSPPPPAFGFRAPELSVFDFRCQFPKAYGCSSSRFPKTLLRYIIPVAAGLHRDFVSHQLPGMMAQYNSAIFVVAIVTIVLTWIFMSLRLLVRVYLKKCFRLDDALAITALVRIELRIEFPCLHVLISY